MSFPGTHFPPRGEGKDQSPAMLTARDLPFSPEGEGEGLQDAGFPSREFTFPPQGEGKGQSPAMLTARDLPFSPEGEEKGLQDARILLG